MQPRASDCTLSGNSRKWNQEQSSLSTTQRVRNKEHTLGAAPALRRVLTVPHLHACEAEMRVVLLQNVHEGCIAIALSGVVVASSQLCSVGTRLEPPVHTCQLGSQMARWLKHICHFIISAL